MKKYTDLSEKEKREFIHQKYEVEKNSFSNIAKSCGTYANKIRRDAIKYNIAIRDKSEAQKNALHQGITKHPTKGQKRTEEVKQKIGMSVLQSWEDMDEESLKDRKNKARLSWQNKTEQEKEFILKQANAAVREAGKTGSKLEKFLLNNLLSNGYVVEFHKEQSILNTKLQIDLFVPKLNVAIEVDGPSHFSPVWGNDTLNRNKKYDDKKTGLIIGKGLYLIRIKQTKDFSNSRGLLIFEQLQSILLDIENKKAQIGKVINIGDE